MIRIFLCLTLFILTGCATNYDQYVKAQVEIDTAKYGADAAKWNAMGAIAVSGTEAAKMTALFMMGGAGGNTQAVQTQLRAPESFGESALKWASILVPGAIQVTGILQNTRAQIHSSDNATALGISTNQAFVGMAGKIQAPAANVTTTIGGNGVIGSG